MRCWPRRRRGGTDRTLLEAPRRIHENVLHVDVDEPHAGDLGAPPEQVVEHDPRVLKGRLEVDVLERQVAQVGKQAEGEVAARRGGREEGRDGRNNLAA